jgi:hypothetical protein
MPSTKINEFPAAARSRTLSHTFTCPVFPIDFRVPATIKAFEMPMRKRAELPEELPLQLGSKIKLGSGLEMPRLPRLNFLTGSWISDSYLTGIGLEHMV